MTDSGKPRAKQNGKLGRPITAEAKVIGTAAAFYSGNPTKPLGHHYDRLAPDKLGDMDIELLSPELTLKMVENSNTALNDKTMVGGEKVIFKNDLGKAGVGFHDMFPQFRQFCDHRSQVLGREVDVKLKADLTPINSTPRPGQGPIEIFRKEGAK